MYRLPDEMPGPPRRNPEDVDEELLEGLEAESLLQPKAPLAPPVLRWRVGVGRQGEEQGTMCVVSCIGRDYPTNPPTPSSINPHPQPPAPAAPSW